MKRPLAVTGIASIGLLAATVALIQPGATGDPTTTAEPGDRQVRPHPFYVPESPPETIQRLPGYGAEDPDFPLLPDEDVHVSRSVGTVTGGHLYNSRRVQLPHPRLEFLPRQYERGYHYTSEPMLQLLDDAARHVQRFAPDRKVHLGNLSRPGGGDVPQSVSHNNGRDADIAFFVVDEDGETTPPPDLIQMDENGRWEGTVGDDTEVLEFDTTANWRFVEGLIESDAADLQYIFVANPLRAKLLAEARRQNASVSTLRVARQVLVQPGGGALPHDDHFHVRIHCTPRDVASGCRERGQPGPTFTQNRRPARETIDRAAALLDHEDPEQRRTAVRRLTLMGDHEHDARIAGLLDDPSSRVRTAAARALADNPWATDALARQLENEQHPRVTAELLEALVGLGDGATDALVATLQRDDHVDFGPAGSLPVASVTADALARHNDRNAVAPLVAALEDADRQVRPQIAHALGILTNHRFAHAQQLRDDERAPEVIDHWREWLAEHGDDAPRDWLARGFEREGYDVSDLDEDDVWELCRAISDARHLSVNAQRVLMDLSDESPESLRWSSYDASFYWRRWFEDRQDQLQLPDIPAELSTADGYTPPDD